MIIIPAIDIIDGKCVRLYKGDYTKEKVYDSNPVDRAKKWLNSGAEIIHIVDLEGAKSGIGKNIETIRNIRNSIDCILEIGGGIRTIKDAETYLNIGIDRIILGTIASKEPEMVQTLAEKYPKRIILGADAKNNQVATDGWQVTDKKDVYEFASSFNDMDLAGVLFTDIDTDGTLKGPNIKAQKKMGSIINNPLIASGGISSLNDIKDLATSNIKNLFGVIVGTALYENKFTLEEAILETKNVS